MEPNQNNPNQPAAPDPRLRQAMASLARGDATRTETLCAQVLAEQPEHPQARFIGALADRQLGRLPRALQTLDTLHQQLPQNPAIRAELAATRVLAGQTDKAIPVLREVVETMPNSPFGHYWLGQAHLRSFRGGEAVRHFERVREISPEDRNVLQPLAAAYLAIGGAAKAEELLRELLEAQPEHVEALSSLAASLEHQNRLPEAGECYRRMTELDPGNGRGLAGTARVLQTEGRNDEARQLLRPRLDDDPPHPVVLATFAGLAETEDDRRACAAHIDTQLDRPDLTAQDRAALCFAGARLRDALGEHDAAFDLYEKGNGLAPQLYDPAERARQTDEIIAAFSPQAVASTLPRATEPSDRPVFIVGMPRSGTTLVEQILAAHPQVHAAGELQEIRRIWRELLRDVGAGSPRRLSALRQSDIDTAARRYLEHIAERNADAPRVTDKMPHNFEQLGLINLLFPNARVIHCRRSPMDTCLSCFTVQLGPAHAFTNSLASLGHAYAQYLRLMEHWRTALDIPILEVVYERVVEDLEPAARAIVDSVGLPWDDACLRFFEARRAVTTASVDQVRKPIYTSSVGRARRYADRLEPLRRALSQAGVADPDNPETGLHWPS